MTPAIGQGANEQYPPHRLPLTWYYCPQQLLKGLSCICSRVLVGTLNKGKQKWQAASAVPLWAVCCHMLVQATSSCPGNSDTKCTAQSTTQGAVHACPKIFSTRSPPVFAGESQDFSSATHTATNRCMWAAHCSSYSPHCSAGCQP